LSALDRSFSSASGRLGPPGKAPGADRQQLSSAILLAFVAPALLTPFFGGLVDRFGVRRVMLPAIVLFAIVTALAPPPPSIEAFLALYALLGVFGAKPIASGLLEIHRGLL